MGYPGSLPGAEYICTLSCILYKTNLLVNQKKPCSGQGFSYFKIFTIVKLEEVQYLH